MLKYAGWDAIVIEGKADKPVWVDIRNDSVVIRDAAGLWGKDTWATQLEIWKLIGIETGTHTGWVALDDLKDAPKRESGDAGRTTQKPAIVAIGPAGENRCHGALIHDAGNGAGQGGFGSVWGSKNLKAISVIGTGSIKVANAKALLQARQALKTKYITSYEHPDFRQWSRIGGLAKPIVQVPIPTEDRRPQACQGCVNGCRSRSNLGYGNESACQETSWYNEFIQKVAKIAEGTRRGRAAGGRPLPEVRHQHVRAADRGCPGSSTCTRRACWARGRRSRPTLPWEKLGTLEFAEKLIHALSTGTDIGRDLAEGWVPAARKWGRERRPRHRHDAVLLLGLPGARLRPARRARVGLRQHHGRPRHQHPLLQLHVHDGERGVRVRAADPVDAEGPGHDPGAQAGTVREGQARGLRLQRPQHVLGGGGPARALAAALLPFLEELGALLRLEVAGPVQHQHAEPRGRDRQRGLRASTCSGTR